MVLRKTVVCQTYNILAFVFLTLSFLENLALTHCGASGILWKLLKEKPTNWDLDTISAQGKPTNRDLDTISFLPPL